MNPLPSVASHPDGCSSLLTEAQSPIFNGCTARVTEQKGSFHWDLMAPTDAHKDAATCVPFPHSLSSQHGILWDETRFPDMCCGKQCASQGQSQHLSRRQPKGPDVGTEAPMQDSARVAGHLFGTLALHAEHRVEPYDTLGRLLKNKSCCVV
eukprot:3728165-Amphidinium_carterae.1